MDERPVIVVLGQRRPHEIMLAAFSAVYGLALFLTGLPLPASLSATAHAAAVGFFVFSAIGGITGLVSAIARRRLGFERAVKLSIGANLFVAAAGVLYVYAIVSLSGAASWLVILLISFVWVAGSIWRAGQLLADLRHIGKGAR